MASSYSNSNSEPAKMEQIIFEFFAKSLHIILESRTTFMSSRNYSGEQTLSSPSSSSSSSSSVRPRDKWFNLALRECPAVLENIDLWRHRSIEPMVVDVILVQRPVDFDSDQCSPRVSLVRNVSLKDRFPNYWHDQEDFGCRRREKIIERWVIQYENQKSSSASKKSSCTSSNILYKKSILLMRSLYLIVRLLPAYKLYRDLNSSAKICTYSLSHRVSTFVEPFTRLEEADMHRFVFTPVATFCGRLCLSVLYHSSLLDATSQLSTPISPQFIPDYVGSPMAYPLKRFPSFPVTRTVSHHSPFSSSFSRRHSWSYDINRASPPSVSFSPSTTYSESRILDSVPVSCCRPPMTFSPHSLQASIGHKKDISYDEYSPFPTFSPTPSRSPPSLIPLFPLSTALSRAESAPAGIPTCKLAQTLALSNKTLPASHPLEGSSYSHSNVDAKTGAMQTTAPGKISFSRSLSRLSGLEDFDDPDFSCAFVEDDGDMPDMGGRQESVGRIGRPQRETPETRGGVVPVRKSQDAAVGELVRLLRRAPPLCRDVSDSLCSPEWAHPVTPRTHDPVRGLASARVPHASSESASSGIFAPKTTADALEEFQGYREMKNLLVKQGGRNDTPPSEQPRKGRAEL